MEVIFYKFKKRINSTKRPSGGTPINVFLKEPTDMHKPVLRLTNVKEGTYNYFKIGGRYYFVNSEVVTPNNWLEIGGQLDAMATCADDIKATTAFVERSTTGSTAIVDTLAPALTDGTWETVSAGPFPYISTDGTYVVTFANLPAPAEMKRGDFLTFYQKLNSPDVIEQVENSIVNLDQLITGAMWLPIQGILTQGTVDIQAGLIPTGVVVNMVDRMPMTGSVNLGNAGSASSLDSSAYVDYELYLPFVGAVPLSADDAKGSISVDVGIDPQTGGVLYIVRSGNSPIASFSGSCGVPIPIGTTTVSAGAVGGSAVGLAASLITGNVIGAVGSAGTMAGAILTGSRTTSTGGSGGSRAGLIMTNIELRRKRRSAPEALSTKSSIVGLPTYRTLSLGSINGFIKCIGASIVSDEDFDIVTQCNSFLNGGAYIE